MNDVKSGGGTTMLAGCFPALPSGYSALAAWGFQDPAGFVYEFYRVYGPTEDGGGRGPIERIDEGLSYWSVAYPAFGPGDDEHMTGRWMTYGELERLSGPRLTFARFSSSLNMRDVVPRLLRVSDIPGWSPTKRPEGQAS